MQERPPAGLEAAPLHVDRAERRSVALQVEWPRVGRTVGAAVRGPAGNVAVRPGTAHQQVDGIAAFRLGRPGAAVVAAALGFVTAAAATAYATRQSPPPVNAGIT